MGEVIDLGVAKADAADAAGTNAGSDTQKDDNLREVVWTCVVCGCQSFALLASGETECCACQRIGCGPEDNQWRSRLPDPPEEPPPLTEDNAKISKLDRHRIKRRFTEEIAEGDHVAMLLVRRDGSQRMWCEGVHNDEQAEWFKDRLETFSEFVFGRSGAQGDN